ncbi:Carotenoid 9,10(9',10')-cleavage dioxygenase [Tetrabaena socialis]|uniref:carotenoid 9,10-dioxygenase n=1 Tax=Tetrabaena socialis TaxID=47790 RepID=A0A2J7ZP39_9CHLO|nr:Carotenoid 9,10(9',10')-cleavage dioxygenase [Tetrabaena socialis]|eukprot:PNH02029.1 Carotenoid 9,10(9',10')-cleavage dioxygenase [Tetrabaena socialis]
MKLTRAVPWTVRVIAAMQAASAPCCSKIVAPSPSGARRLAQALGVVSVKNGAGTGNTALAFHAGRLLALHEGDLPYAIRVLCSGLVETMGRLKLGGAPLRAFTAHPKIDPVNGEMLFINYRFEANPYVTAGVLDEYGNLIRRWGVELPYPVMMHDMGATQSYIVLMHLPLCFDPEPQSRKA